MTTPIIEANSLTKYYKVYIPRKGFIGHAKDIFKREYKIIHAVSGIDLSINKGEIVGYIGLNGAGKSTSIKMLTGIMKASEGNVKICGLNPYENRKKIAGDISVIFGQKTHLWTDLPVCDSFELIKEMYNIPKEQYEEKMEWLNTYLNFDEIWKQQVRKLSLGQKMLCEIAVSLIYNPKILFLDEPTIGLDVLVKNKVISLIKEINRTYETTVLVTSHDLKDIESLCNRIIMIDKGSIVYDGSLQNVFERYGEGGNKVIFYAEKNLEAEDFTSISKKYTIEINDNELCIEYDDKYPVTAIISEVIQCYGDFYDMTIKKGDLEEVVKKIYA